MCSTSAFCCTLSWLATILACKSERFRSCWSGVAWYYIAFSVNWFRFVHLHGQASATEETAFLGWFCLVDETQASDPTQSAGGSPFWGDSGRGRRIGYIVIPSSHSSNSTLVQNPANISWTGPGSYLDPRIRISIDLSKLHPGAQVCCSWSSFGWMRTVDPSCRAGTRVSVCSIVKPCRAENRTSNASNASNVPNLVLSLQFRMPKLEMLNRIWPRATNSCFSGMSSRSNLPADIDVTSCRQRVETPIQSCEIAWWHSL